ncbi:hypothetical protein BC830DRAFT_1111885 [Chytriomyces sp. MP71]|nr:hypothetical protein BC830DRAFT_1111885 [Chytriomyces sp. MP71]
MSFGGIGSAHTLGNSIASSWATGNFGSDAAEQHSVAVSHLKKLGWKAGDGLGKKRDGINRAISVGFKNDTRGVGANKDEFGFSWWDHVFNKASSSIQISKGSDSEDEIKVSVQRNSVQQKQLLYGSFIKTAGDEEDEEKDYSIKVTDAELFAACEGRTARKGARAEQPGKLQRVVKDKVDLNVATHDATEIDVKRKDKKDKKKRKQEDTVDEKPGAGESVSKEEKKRRKKQKQKGVEADDGIDADVEGDKRSTKDKKRRHKEVAVEVQEKEDKALKKATKKRKERGENSDPASKPAKSKAIHANHVQSKCDDADKPKKTKKSKELAEHIKSKPSRKASMTEEADIKPLKKKKITKSH